MNNAAIALIERINSNEQDAAKLRSEAAKYRALAADTTGKDRDVFTCRANQISRRAANLDSAADRQRTALASL